MKYLSVIIVTYNRANILKNLLSQIERGAPDAEVIIIINDSSNDAYKELMAQYPHQWIEKTFKSPGEARNHGLKSASREWILFLDDDVSLPESFFSKAANQIESHPEVDIMGGPDSTPPQSGVFAKALGQTLKSPMATAHTAFRHKSEGVQLKKGHEGNLILCNLWLKRDFQIKHQLTFHPEFFRNEENVLLKEAQDLGAKALYCPQIFVYHYRKTRLDQLAKAVLSSGQNRLKSLLLTSVSINPIFLIPAIWLVYLMTLPFYPEALPYRYFPLQLYISLTIFLSLKVSEGNILLFPLIIFYQVFINVLYGLGVMIGILKSPLWLFRSRF